MNCQFDEGRKRNLFWKREPVDQDPQGPGRVEVWCDRLKIDKKNFQIGRVSFAVWLHLVISMCSLE